MSRIRVALVAGLIPLAAIPATAQVRPDLSGVWRLVPEDSRLVGGGGAPSEEHQVTWLVDHRDPEIAVVVNVRDARGSHEFSFRCTTDGEECVNDLASISEQRRMSAVWDGPVLVMSQHASAPHGDFETRDRLMLSDSGDRLVFERIVTNERGERAVRQVFRKLGPHPSQRPPPDPLPSVELPPELDRVLRDYERHWHAGNADSLVALFTADGFVARRGWIRGQAGLRQSLQRTSSDLRLRAVSYAIDGRVGHIIGAYGYGSDEPSVPDRGLFILTLLRGADGRWLISADLDSSIRP